MTDSKRKYKGKKRTSIFLIGILAIIVGVVSYQLLIKNEKLISSTTKLPQISSKQAILINLNTEEIIGEKGATTKIYPASLTKIMTAYVASQLLEDQNELVRVPQEIFDQLYLEEASLAGFFGNEEVPAKELLYGVILPSGAEASLALAYHLAGSEEAFVKLMNETSQNLGMGDTHFTNVTGLHNANHYSTVKDLSLLLKAALGNPLFRSVFTTKEHMYTSEVQPEGLFLASRLFSQMTSNKIRNGSIDGGKTGYTKEAKQCLASLATINGTEYILITTGANGEPSKNNQHIKDAKKIYQAL